MNWGYYSLAFKSIGIKYKAETSDHWLSANFSPISHVMSSYQGNYFSNNLLPSEQNGRCYADDIFKYILLKENVLIQISMKIVS